MDVLKGSQNIKWGIIGCGDVCQVKSGPALYKCIGSELVAVMRRDEAKAKAFALKHKVARYYTNYKDLIKDKEVNAIYIASPPGSHADIAMACALAGKPCLVEKPIARSGHEATAVVNTFKDLNVPLFVAYYRRAHHRFITAKHIIATHLGQVTSVSVAFSTPTQLKYSSKELGWRISPELSGGGLFMDVGCHTLDILDFLLGSLGHVNGDAVYFPSPLDKDGENKVSNGSSNSSNGKGGVNTRHHHIGNNSSNNGSHTDSGSNSSSSGNGHSSSGKGNSSHITHNNNNNSSNSNVKVENLVAMSFRLPNGAIGSAQWNFLSAQSEDLLTIYGTKGKLTMSVFGSDSPLLVTDSGERVEFKTKYPQHAHQPLVQSIINELRLSRSGVSSNKAGHICESKGTSALRTNIVMDAVLRKFYRNRNDQFWTRPETYSL